MRNLVATDDAMPFNFRFLFSSITRVEREEHYYNSSSSSSSNSSCSSHSSSSKCSGSGSSCSSYCWSSSYSGAVVVVVAVVIVVVMILVFLRCFFYSILSQWKFSHGNHQVTFTRKLAKKRSFVSIFCFLFFCLLVSSLFKNVDKQWILQFSPPVAMETIQDGRQTKELIRSLCQRYCMLT